MKKLLVIFTILLTLTPVLVLAQGEYQPLEPSLFDAVGGAPANPSLSNYIEKGFTLFLVVTVVLCVLLIVVGGVEIIVSEVPGVKVQGKARITAALSGLALALGAALLLQILNPKILDFDLDLKNIATPTTTGGIGGTDQGGGGPTSTTTPPTGTDGCPGCVAISDYNLPIKASACAGSSCTIDANTAQKLADMNQAINRDNPNINWEITEAYPPTRTHRNACHSQGTCVDAAIRSDKNGANLETFADTARSAGLRPVYEVSTEARKQELISQGYTGEILALGSHISGEHFSIYAN